MSEIKFISGLRVYAPHAKAPEFVKGAIVIKTRELIEWLGEHYEEEVRLDIKVSKAGSWYASVNDYKPKQEDPLAQARAVYQNDEVATDDIKIEDIPF